ncbi:MAG: glucans biosynthesis glucosyltransferase MdoH, partial [Rhodobacteraceae bacterium]|nr:glucans biosynthesis glucosyltransferase MdoH [Paracoccaceae bacterium]
AVLVPIYEEDVGRVVANIRAMRAELATYPTAHSFAFFVLSDSRSAHATISEELAMAEFVQDEPEHLPVYYRRRSLNRDRKAGNLGQWLQEWGGAWDAMLPLDADSVMSAQAIVALADALANDPTAGLIQSQPRLIRSVSLYGRMQQFATALYSPLMGRGLARWSGHAANYWGHNAIIRTRAFAAAAGLPKLRGARGRQDLILSHDFVEAALLRRAGWGVRLLPAGHGSYEETPQTLIDYVLRDRRWCRGNLQHLRIVFARGLHPVSRFHLLHGALSYLMSPLWLAMLAIWVLGSVGAGGLPVLQFIEQDPRYVVSGAAFQPYTVGLLLAIYGLLIGPKLLAVTQVTLRPGGLTGFGAPGDVARNVVLEILGSILIAPILMVQQTRSVIASCLGSDDRWAPQRRGTASGCGFVTCLRFHWVEMAIGLVVTGAMVAGMMSLWLLPVTLSLLAAPLVSWASGLQAPRLWQTPEDAAFAVAQPATSPVAAPEVALP